MSPKLPCLFCFSNSRQQEGYHYQGGEKARRDRVYRFLRDLLGIKLPPEEDFNSLGLGHNSYLPLCISCSLVFRNLSGLHEQLILFQDKVNSVVQEIRDKIKNSKGNETSALAVAINSIEEDSDAFVKPATPTISSSLAWMQKFRQKVAQKDSTSVSIQNALFVLGTQQIIEEHGEAVAEQIIYPSSFHLVQETVTTSTPAHHIELDYCENDYEEENDYEDDQSAPDHFFMEDSDSTSAGDECYNYNKSKSSIERTKSQNRIASAKKKSNLALSRIRKKVASISPIKKTKPPAAKKSSPTKSSSSSAKTVKIKKLPKLTEEQKELRKYKCHMCPWRFDKGYKLKAHLLIHSGLKQQEFYCEPCKRHFSARKYIKAHNLEEHGDMMPYKCTVCTVQRSTSAALRSHMKDHKDAITGPPWICDKCNNEFKSKLNLKRHLGTHEKLTSFQCPLCPSRYSRKEDMMHHMNKKHRSVEPSNEGKKLNCNLCSNQYNTPAELIAHIWSHGTKKRLTCTLCDMLFQTKDEFSLHNERLHGVEIKRVPCPECDLIFVTKDLLKLHMKSHAPIPVTPRKTPVNTVGCKKCDKTFTTSNLLTRHMRVFHADKNARPFACNKCEWKFKRPEELRKHTRRVHENPQVLKQKRLEHACDLCNKDFTDRRGLERHVRTIHELGDTRPFACEYCNSSFKRSDDLRKHERRQHDLDRPLPNRPLDETKVERPIRIKKEVEKPFECDICDCRYVTNEALKRHERDEHNLVRPRVVRKSKRLGSRNRGSQIKHKGRVKIIVTSLAPEGTESSDPNPTISETIMADIDDSHSLQVKKKKKDIDKDADWEQASSDSNSESELSD